MIVKPLLVPSTIKKLEALTRRLPHNHIKRPQLEKELAQRLAGYRGELSLDYYLMNLPLKKHFIFHDLRLPGNNGFFQLDLLLLTPYYFLILEVKNISGPLLFDQNFHQLIRIQDGVEEGFADPVLQIQRQREQLSQWLEQKHLPQLPIETLIVISSPRTIVHTKSSASIRKFITRSSVLTKNIEHFDSVHLKEVLTNRQLKKLTKYFLQQHTPESINPQIRFALSHTDLLKGVYCPK
ncbi:nuclease-related domain-containing protein [Fictibacillus enclensis]|uniref:nuclease-related domain-containing protein n=1 Tax=Fictibacillus enclensis TaxID=1017270 RepID=UPI0024C0AEF2|nr:nuclease-related domain-containing protein [Fictibacillus enclensis]WHY71545.1 nuclease-related domain-containing protein [Fictibacillus enclensis]